MLFVLSSSSPVFLVPKIVGQDAQEQHRGRCSCCKASTLTTVPFVRSCTPSNELPQPPQRLTLTCSRFLLLVTPTQSGLFGPTRAERRD